MSQNGGYEKIDYHQSSIRKGIRVSRISGQVAQVLIIFICFQIAAILVYLYSGARGNTREILVFGSIALAVSVILAILISLAQSINQLMEAIKVGNDNSKLDRTINYIARWNSNEISESRKNVLILMRKLKSVSGSDYHLILDSLDEEADIREDLTLILNFFEEMSIGVELGMLNEDLLRRFYKSIIFDFYIILSPYIETHRQALRNPNIFSSFTYLARKWN